STSKTPSYTKSVSWQHHQLFSLSNLLAETQRAEKLGTVTRTFFIADTHFNERHPKRWRDRLLYLYFEIMNLL
ncbi:hypothetical protein, partial [Shigella dysenteriae]|uniref:hypothetical protein n=1 Tax=Shigella dysenteriae TaxID=622 RepID=UPI0019D47583